MDSKEKKQLSEADIKAKFITPAIVKAGWDEMTQIRREVTLTPGPVVVRGNLSSRNKKKKKFADYVLQKEKGVPVAVVEAKENNYSISHGLQQALGYADILDVPSAFSSNGDGFASHNKVPVEGDNIEKELSMDNFPSPDELWKRYKAFRGIEDEQEKLVTQPYYDDGSGKEPRYYQAEAINRVVEKVAQGEKRLLLVMATGTGKTYTTFQIIWRLWQAKKVKRILFLVDRNILADQTLVNDFKPFGSVMTKIKNRKIDPAYEIYLGLYQALTGPYEEDKIFKSVSRDFFDLIVIDECHRGSANADSAWKEILEYFDSAVQLGLTATPKETEYASNITYFGEPVYTYTLKQGIQDGFLAPYKVVRIDIDKDILGWIPSLGMKDDLGNPIEQRLYNQADMDRILVLNKRTTLVAERVMKLLKATDPYSKTIIFCEDIDHAERMRKAIVNAAGKFATDNSKYVMRITGDSIEGKAELDNFIDPESRYPVIATTSELLTTGVDAKTCKLIVLDKTINSMTTFKQIVGRGTRIEESQNKYFFTIMDFKKATELFKDPEFDGEPVVIYEPTDDDDPVPPDPTPIGDEDDESEVQETEGRYKIRVSGVEVSILSERVEYLGEDGFMVTESYRDYSRKNIRKEFSSLDDFLQKWQSAKKKAAIIEALGEYGIELPKLAQEVGKDYGDFDLICHIAFDQPPLTKKERANQVKKRDYFAKYGEQMRAVLEALLDKYADEGIVSIENNNVLKLNPFSSIGTPVEIINGVFGGKTNYELALQDLENELFKQAQ
ncbi:MAG: DEAD/DEAH box helicase family protein [Gammaproteobacteria bacterium]|nr:DEAD/DEAH box helicase family protein [Gammaproteobacteria bacterium]MBU2059029.1 DEAD/DEAH box helicase family protein [Gammaproteobacteria bacterium]MBU2174792.1 DEAD/DEAH box helicase family protein [Gammaproteobacteria bacterium]MBU2245761.1 DEAD/DEAH box helicase family protein [Gammaproteobacteria bacterium]MBU2343243.1 DEAD/DEAH box helicase family protein [Gammaproteobacteria bacterium]